MAKGKKTGGRDFKPGQKVPGCGRPALPPDVREAKALQRNEVQILLTQMLEMDRSELQTIVNNPKEKAIRGLVASIVLHGIKKGDQMRMNFLLDRIVGKVKDEMEHTLTHSHTIEEIRQLPIDQKVTVLETALAKLKEAQAAPQLIEGEHT